MWRICYPVWMTLSAYLNRFRCVKCLSRAMLWNAWTFRLHCSQFWVYSHKSTWCLWWKIPLENPGNGISEALNFKMSPDASALKNLCLWCEFQSHLLFIISLILKNCLTALNWPFLTLVKAARNFSTACASKDGSS